ncbi:hypothetical protein MQX03_10600 [Chryseobacterium aahli]|nr:hypothetical protein [Chryseobacterium aahli]MCI3937654.1 hypothetical protein [Chryseobacterium aahli]
MIDKLSEFVILTKEESLRYELRFFTTFLNYVRRPSVYVQNDKRLKYLI